MDFFDKLRRLTIFSLILLVIVIAAGIAKAVIESERKAEKKHLKKSDDIREICGMVFGVTKGLKKRYCYSPLDAEGNVLALGAPGTGKTSALLIPSLRTIRKGKNKGTAFVIDIAGDISKNVHDKNKIEFDPDYTFTPVYNVFATVDRLKTKSEQDQELARLAHLIMPDEKNASPNSKYFQDGGRSILTAALTAFYHQQMDFCEICYKILSNGYSRLFEEIDSIGYEPAILYINKFESSNEANIGGCKENCDSAITLFATNENIKNAIGRDPGLAGSFSPGILETKSVYVEIADEKLQLYAPLLRIMTAQFLDYFTSRKIDKDSHSIIFALDEFATLGLGGDDIVHAARVLRKRKVKLWIFCQSLIDLDVLYGKDMRTALTDNMIFCVVLSARSTETQNELSAMIGKKDVTKRSYSGVTLLSNGTTNISTEKENIIDPADLANLGDDLIVIYPGGYKRLQKNYYFKENPLKVHFQIKGS